MLAVFSDYSKIVNMIVRKVISVIIGTGFLVGLPCEKTIGNKLVQASGSRVGGQSMASPGDFFWGEGVL